MDDNQIPVEIVKTPPPISSYFKTLSATLGIFVLVAGLGIAVKLSQNRQSLFSKAGFGPVAKINLSMYPLTNKYGFSANAVDDLGRSITNVSYQWGVSSTNSIGNLDIHSSNRYAEFILNGNLGQADIWVMVDGGITASYQIIIGPLPTPAPVTTPSSFPTPTPIKVTKIGDANGDGKVDGADYAPWVLHYGETTANKALDGDFNEDGRVDGVDYSIWLLNYQ